MICCHVPILINISKLFWFNLEKFTSSILYGFKYMTNGILNMSIFNANYLMPHGIYNCLYFLRQLFGDVAC